eukprot:9455156-Alexandrium_andersonii.AAC.1
MPAAKYFPAKANFIKPPVPGVQQAQFAPRGCDVFKGPTPPVSEMKNINAMNFVPRSLHARRRANFVRRSQRWTTSSAGSPASRARTPTTRAMRTR